MGVQLSGCSSFCLAGVFYFRMGFSAPLSKIIESSMIERQAGTERLRNPASTRHTYD